jgi:hypothetical protein
MREHEHCADETTLNALRHLRQPWRGWEAAQGVVRVQMTDGVVIRLTVARDEPEAGFVVHRLAADFERGAVRPVRPVAGYDGGTNDVVILEGESWLTRLVRPKGSFGVETPVGSRDAVHEGAPRALVTHGPPHQRPANADARCSTTDAVVVASPRGLLWLARVGEASGNLEIVTDASRVRDVLDARRPPG